MLARPHTSIDQLDPQAWNALGGTDVPFLRHEFLAALEHTGCVGPGTGWTPAYVALHDATGLAAAAPAFIKTHSYGEFVFDFSWAEAYAHFGRNYYPKLSVCVPFTPATGARLLVRPDLDGPKVRQRLARAMEEFAAERQLSSAHALFFDEPGREAFEQSGWLLRRDCQFHWANQGFTRLRAVPGDLHGGQAQEGAPRAAPGRRKRASISRPATGTTSAARCWIRSTAFTAAPSCAMATNRICRARSSAKSPRTLGESLMFKIAMLGTKPVAAAVFFWCQEALYGRYWGAAEEHHSLHFETCYHQGIEFCIERGIRRFEPGTQGEHKVARGFAPTLTWSAHHIGDRRFRSAVRDYLVREGAAVDAYATQVSEHVPYRRDT